jgi:hypothetical protein
MKYGIAEDDLVLWEVGDPTADLKLLWTHYPPSHGLLFFYQTKQIFDVVEIDWHRKAIRRGAENPRRDVLEFAHLCRWTVLVDHEGEFHILSEPGTFEEADVVAAGGQAEFQITSAPSLFG